MKKLMILVAVAMMAVCSQAASIKWAANSLTDKNGATLSDVLVTCYCVETGLVVGTATASSGSISGTLMTTTDFTAGNYYNFYMTYTDAAGNVFTSASKKTKAQSGSTPGITFNMNNGSWSSVPEPTSALLLLLGVAGLALKRKVA